MTELMWQQSFLRFGICVLLAGVLWFIPISEDLPVKGWHVFSVFIAVIVSFILRPYPIGAFVGQPLGLESLTKLFEVVPTDEYTSDVEQGLMDLGPPLPADS